MAIWLYTKLPNVEDHRPRRNGPVLGKRVTPNLCVGDPRSCLIRGSGWLSTEERSTLKQHRLAPFAGSPIECRLGRDPKGSKQLTHCRRALLYSFYLGTMFQALDLSLSRQNGMRHGRLAPPRYSGRGVGAPVASLCCRTLRSGISYSASFFLFFTSSGQRTATVLRDDSVRSRGGTGRSRMLHLDS